ncbi:MAG TPA: alpha-hydroxy-acid oxidizing protein, partial [Phenylobacterium sp.]|nr:alpha-hydroxy-acid oxidizing protein [Phenylobacterium sp.]
MSSDPTRIGAGAGLAAARPVLPPGVFCAQDYERLAEERLSPAVFAHTAGGSGGEAALARNRSAFEAAVTTPRMLVDFDGANTRARVGGIDLPHPILLAPLAHQGLYHPQGELETAQAAAVVGAGLVCSTLSSNSL